MKKIVYFLLIASLLVLVGCATNSGNTDSTVKENIEVDTVSAATPLGSGWIISLVGVRKDELWQSHFELWKNEDDAYIEMELEKKGETKLYGGILLKDAVAMVDDPVGGMPYKFQENLWNEGYDITLTAADGYSATFSTTDVSFEEILLFDTINGEAVTPGIAGNISTKVWIQNLEEVEISLAPVELSNNTFELVLDINKTITNYTISELELMDIYIESEGSLTNSYGNISTGLYGGVKLIPFLSKSMEVTPETAIKIIAMDGYEMDYSGEMLLDQSDGDWVLAFKENGEYMPEDPGYLRLVKIGPEIPNITSHASAKMIKKIVTEGSPFKDFNLTIVENEITEIFDRQNLQSGVMANKDRVFYYDRKSDTNIPYMGISIWKLLERLNGYSAVTIEATDGFSITLDNNQLEGNDDVILAMYTGGDDQLLNDNDWPLRLVWDKDAAIIPEGIKSVRNVTKILLVY